MDAYKQITFSKYGECNYCDYLICYKRKKNCWRHKQRKPCKHRRGQLKSKYMRSRVRQKIKQGLDF